MKEIKPRVISELTNTNVNRQLRKLFRKAGIKLLPKNTSKEVDFRIVSLSRTTTYQEIRKKLGNRENAKIIVFTDGQLNGKQMKWLFSGRTLSVHDKRDSDGLQECVDRVLDELFLQKYLQHVEKESSPWFGPLKDTAVCIIDRSYRAIYMNKRHRETTPGPNNLYGLCWQQHRNLFDRTKPCNGCPATRLFDHKMIPDPQYRVRKKDRASVVCSRLQVLPINDSERNRIVASLEISVEVNPRNYTENRVEQDKMLESCLESVLDEGFTRSRVFVYVSPTKSLKGYKERYIDPAGKITADFTKVILPYDQYDNTVFRGRKPVTRRHIRGEIMEALYEDIFQKDLAYYWGEFPLFVARRKLGKLIVDKFHRNKKIRQFVTMKEMNSIWPYASFIQKLLRNMSQIESVELPEALLEYQKNVISKVLSPSTASSALETMLKWIPRYMKGIVCSGYLRVLNSQGDRLVLSPLFSVSGLKRASVKPIGLKDSKKLSSVVYETEMPLAKTLTQEELRRFSAYNSTHDYKIEAKCSIPLVVCNTYITG